jgi:hypothetical protein
VPEWRNGRRRGLKILRAHARVGSTPISGTKSQNQSMASFIQLFPGTFLPIPCKTEIVKFP